MTRIAIVGMSCRFAGAPNVQAFWRLTRSGGNAFGPVPADRWSEAMFHSASARDMDRTTAPRGAFIDDIRSFPALALGIPPRRVEVMDPQQRLTLLCALEAIEDAGYRPGEIPRRTGVFVGLTATEYRVLQATRIAAMMMASGQLGRAPADLAMLADAVENVVPPRPFSAPGVLGNMSAAAVAQELDLHGPAYTVDAACASALVAVADAVAQLRAGQIDAALAGGAYLQITPEHFIAFSRIGAMSDSGHCRPFDARADGFVQGDGAGMILLKRLDDAIRDGDRVFATIEGVAINNDGRGDGPMAPVLEGQADVIDAAWKDARHPPAKVGFVETHGTGTDVGDVTEVQGIKQIFGDAKEVWIGSAKANVGHTMSAAGIAGIIKTALAIHHAEVPPLGGFEQPKDALGLDGTGLRIPTAPVPWKDKRRLAGVSSFGFGGTNGHAVLAAAPEAKVKVTPQWELVLLSAGTEADLRATAADLAAAVRDDARLDVAGIARAWARRRRQPVRASVVARDRDTLLAGLDALASGGAGMAGMAGTRSGTAPEQAPKLAFLYPGQGAQRVGMLRDVRARFPVVQAALARVEDASGDLLRVKLGHLLYPETRRRKVAPEVAAAELTATEHCQPAMFAAGVALTDLLAAVGVRPHVVTGHSLGEIVAATVGGAIGEADAARFVCARGRAMADLPGDHGAMAAIMADRATVEPLLVDGAVIANENHPRQLVVSGARAAVEAVVARAAAAGISAKPLDVSHAFHSPVLAGLDSEALVAGLTFADPTCAVASGIAERPYADAADARAVFVRHATSPVIFTRALQQCVDAGADLFVQVGAGGPLASFARGTLPPGSTRGVLTLASLEDDDGGFSLLDTLGALWVAGVDVDVRPITAPAPLASVPPVLLPTEPYWAVKDTVTRALKLDPNAKAAPRTEPRPEPFPVAAVAAVAPVAPVAPVDGEVAPNDDVEDAVLKVVAKVSAYPREALRTGARLVEDLGFDSLMMGDLSAALANAFPGLGGIPQELLINSPTVADLVRFVREGGSATPATAADDDAPLAAWAPTWRKAPLPELPGRPLREGRWAVTGPELPAAERLARQLHDAGLPCEAVARPSEDVAWAGIVWVAPPVTPRVAAVLAGTTPWPDLAGDLLDLLAAHARRGRRPDVVVVAASDDAWSAGPAGAVRALAREWPEALAKVVWTDERTLLPKRIVAELTSADRSVDVLYRGTTRYVRGLDRADDVTAPLSPDDVVVITGGTRGIGLRLGLRLAPRVARVILVGRSTPSEADAAAIATLGNVTCLAADVLDLTALRAGLAAARATVVVHAAGLLADGPIEAVDPAAGLLARRVKVEGWLHALRACGSTVRKAIGVGSWAGRFGNRHQAWYAAANAQLAELAAHAPPGVTACVLEMGPWTDSEMARSIPAPVRQAMRADGVDFVGTTAGLDAIEAAIGAGGARVSGRALPATLQRVQIELGLSTETDPYLLDHAIDGTPILPLAAATDLMAWVAGVRPPFTVEDVTLYQGVVVREPVRVVVAVDADKASVRLRRDGNLVLAYTARVHAGADADAPAPPTGGAPPAFTRDRFYAEGTFHGPLLQGITTIDAVGERFVTGAVRAGRPAEWTPGTPRAAFTVDPLALDSAMQLGATLPWSREGRGGTPVRIGRLRVLGPVTGALRAEAHAGEAAQDRFSATLVLRGADGAPVLIAEDVVAELRAKGDATAGDAPFAPTPELYDPAAWPEVQALEARLAGVVKMGLRIPYFHVHEGTARNTTVVGGRRLVNFSSYNYVGLSGDPDVLAAVHAAVERYGTSVSASRVASGERPFHGELEALLARAQGAEDAVLFTAGHATNVTTIGHLFGPEDLILHDEYIHDSALQGIKLSGAARRYFRHDDPAHLARQLEQLRPHYRRCLIVVEGVYSMDGDICDLPAYVELKDKHGCLLMVDEAHSFGIVGATGRGVAEHFGIDGRRIDVWMGTLSKSLASCGGWIAGSRSLINYLRYTAPGFVYSAGLTAANGVAALAALKKMLAEPWRVRQLQDNAAFFHDALVSRGMDTGPAKGGSGVVPVITGSSAHALMLSQALQDQGVNVQPIVYPAVAEAAARLRFFLSSTHTRAELLETAERVSATLHHIRAEHPGL